MRFEMPLPEVAWSTNQDRNLHHMKRAERIKNWKDGTVIFYRQAARYREGPELPPSFVTVHIPFKDNRRRDPHNYCGTVVKAVIDGLVIAKAWPDDTYEYVEHREPRLYKGDLVVVDIEPR